MRFIIEFEGTLVDIAPAYHQSHEQAAAEVGWSRLDAPTFRRLTRTKGPEANLLPGASQAKINQYNKRFAQLAETDEAVGRCHTHAAVPAALAVLAKSGPCIMVSLGSNLTARRNVLDRAELSGHFAQTESLSPDPERRPGELKALAAGDERTIVAAASDSIIRSAGAAGLLAVGLTSGLCSAERLHRGGAGVVYRNLSELATSIQSGAPDLIRAGLLPPPMGN